MKTLGALLGVLFLSLSVEGRCENEEPSNQVAHGGSRGHGGEHGGGGHEGGHGEHHHEGEHHDGRYHDGNYYYEEGGPDYFYEPYDEPAPLFWGEEEEGGEWHGDHGHEHGEHHDHEGGHGHGGHH